MSCVLQHHNGLPIATRRLYQLSAFKLKFPDKRLGSIAFLPWVSSIKHDKRNQVKDAIPSKGLKGDLTFIQLRFYQCFRNVQGLEPVSLQRVLGSSRREFRLSLLAPADH